MSNTDQIVRFDLAGEVLERKLVTRPAENEAELNTQSPVGQALLSATVGQTIEVETPSGTLTVTVLSINGHQSDATGG